MTAVKPKAPKSGGQAYVFLRERWSVRAGEWLIYAITRCLFWITRPFGLWSLASALAPIGGWIALVVPSLRRRAEHNLQHAWPELGPQERRRLIAEAGASAVRLVVEYSQIHRLKRSVPLDVQGVEHLEYARQSGRGVILATAHYGNWECARFAAKAAGHESGIIYRAFNNRYIDRFAMGFILCGGGPVMQKGPAGLRALIAHLNRGGVAMILVDQRNSGAPMIEFLGQPAETMVTAAELARRCDAALIPVVSRRDVQKRRFAVRFEPEVPSGPPEAMMAEVNARISSWIDDEPGQWLWFHQRWRKAARPRGAAARR
ncbi:MAG: lysophospholipid acyltransferase family protein [Pseudomonadota bacterium]